MNGDSKVFSFIDCVKDCSMDCISGFDDVFAFVCHSDHLTLVWVERHEPLGLPLLQIIQVILEDIGVALCGDSSV